MRVFLTGATGYIGSAVLDALQRSGHRVTALVRDPEKAERLRARTANAVVGELATARSYLDALNDTEAVIHAAFEDSVRGVEKDRQALDTLITALAQRHSGAPVFIYTSGVWVLGSTTKPADEGAPLDPAPHVA